MGYWVGWITEWEEGAEHSAWCVVSVSLMPAIVVFVIIIAAVFHFASLCSMILYDKAAYAEASVWG